MNSANTIQTLVESTCENCPLFSLYNVKTVCKIVDIYDGDTTDVIIAYRDQLYHFKARLYGYDSHEMKPSKMDPNRDTKKQLAIAAKQRLWNLCTDLEPTNFTGQHSTILPVICGEFDKYGRILINIFRSGTNLEDQWTNNNMDEWFSQTINSQMINEGYGYPYYGGTKKK
jgi:endonuclease YncB( thermonuclease family)